MYTQAQGSDRRLALGGPKVAAQEILSTDNWAYAGIGARETPSQVLESIEAAARALARAGWTLRTGMSPGADQAFYRGAIAERGRLELYLPFAAFAADARCSNEGPTVFVLVEPAEAAYSLAARFHPSWSALSPDARRLLARDVHQVLGRDLNSPAAFVVCWTRDGSLDGSEPSVGGTGQALRIAHHHAIAVRNLARPDHAQRLSRCVHRG